MSITSTNEHEKAILLTQETWIAKLLHALQFLLHLKGACSMTDIERSSQSVGYYQKTEGDNMLKRTMRRNEVEETAENHQQ